MNGLEVHFPNAAFNKGFVRKTILEKYSWKLLKSKPTPQIGEKIFIFDYGKFTNFILLLGFIGDISFKPPSNVVLFFQDSYSERTLAHIMAKRYHGLECLFNVVNHFFIKFDLVILLESELDTRKQRNRQFSDSYDNSLIDDVAFVIKMDNELRRIVEKNNNYLLINTSVFNIDETLEYALQNIYKCRDCV